MNSSCIEINSDNFIENVQLRFLCKNDIPELKRLCADWFPIKYPDAWFHDVTSGSEFFSLGAVYANQLIGVIVSSIKHRSICNKEDSDILGYWYPSNTNIGYIMILGVVKEFRRKGIASHLLRSFLDVISSPKYNNCKVIYLHVLASNASAVLFYERQHFKRHKHLPLYYLINGSRMDGYCYVLYVNNGEPPWTISHVVQEASSFLGHLSICRLTHFFVMRLWIRPSQLLFSRFTRRSKENSCSRII